LTQAQKRAAGPTMAQAVTRKSPASYRGDPVLIHVVFKANEWQWD